MRLLLDTHVFLWYITNDHRLSSSLAEAISAESSEAYLSVVSVWETLVKYQLGRLHLPELVPQYLEDRQAQHRIITLPLEAPAVSTLVTLPPHHRDPFDRMLICQAIYHDLTIVTSDEQIVKYPVRTFRPG